MCNAIELVPVPAWARDNINLESPEYGVDLSGQPCFAIDACIATALRAVWAAGYRTLGCCCGHGQAAGGIITIDLGKPGYAGPCTDTQLRYEELHTRRSQEGR